MDVGLHPEGLLVPYDQFIHFDKGKRPTKDELRDVMVAYLGEYATSLPYWKDGRWHIMLVGKGSTAWTPSLGPSPPPELVREERFLELFCDDNKTIDVITRQQDEATNKLAEGLADIIARFWGGRVERG